MSDPLAPIRDPRVTLNDLVEVILERGVVLHLDLVIAVADIPLIGVNLRAAVAGLETMLSYGMMRQWDESMRRFAERSLTRDLPLVAAETITRCAMASMRVGSRGTWRPGMLYVTSERILVARRSPREVLLDLPRADLASASVSRDEAIGGRTQDVLRLETRAGTFVEIISTQIGHVADALGAGAQESQPPRGEQVLELWFDEPRSGSTVWRRGRARITRGTLAWTGNLDRGASVRLALGDVHVIGARASSVGPALVLRDPSGAHLRFAGPGLDGLIAAVGRERVAGLETEQDEVSG